MYSLIYKRPSGPLCCVYFLSLIVLLPSYVQAQKSIPRAEPSATQDLDKVSDFRLKLGGYVETFYQWNFNNPSNRITNFRGFDNRHDTFTISNAAFDAHIEDKRLTGHLTLQVGHTPNVYYSNEPRVPGTTAANTSDAELWKYLQQAYVGYRFPVGQGLLVEAGLFLSPVGPVPARPA